KVGRDTVWAFPDPARLAAARVREMRALKYSTRKAEYIRDLARAIVSGALDLEALCAAESALVIERLTALRGLGRWTADWFLARCLGRGEVFPAGDLAVRKAFVHYYGRGRALAEDTIRRRARAWGEHQNLAVHYILAGMRLSRPAVGGGAWRRPAASTSWASRIPARPKTCTSSAGTRSASTGPTATGRSFPSSASGSIAPAAGARRSKTG